MKHQDFHGTCSATIQAELLFGLLLIAEYDLKYTASPYDRGDYWNPPEGGDVEDIEWNRTSMTILDNEGDEIAFSLSEQEREELEERVNTEMESEATEICRKHLRDHYDD